MFLPRCSGWEQPDLEFSVKSVLRREYPGFSLITIFFFVSETLEAIVLDHEGFLVWIDDEPVWLALLIFGAMTYFGLRLARKSTNWLAVAGR